MYMGLAGVLNACVVGECGCGIYSMMYMYIVGDRCTFGWSCTYIKVRVGMVVGRSLCVVYVVMCGMAAYEHVCE